MIHTFASYSSYSIAHVISDHLHFPLKSAQWILLPSFEGRRLGQGIMLIWDGISVLYRLDRHTTDELSGKN